jgi:hypothetical protein
MWKFNPQEQTFDLQQTGHVSVRKVDVSLKIGEDATKNSRGIF